LAIIFCLAAECGYQRTDAERFVKHFDGLKIAISNAPPTSCEGEIFPHAADSWESVIFPLGAGLAGRGEDIPEFYPKEKLTEIGWLLYEYLRSAPPYRYAYVGIDPVFKDALLTTVAEKNHRGLVVSGAVLKSLNFPANFVPFTTGYYWIPYEGEDVGLE
jgi:hypothetical protein